MKLHFAGPLFTTAERAWNAEVTAALRAAGHEIFLRSSLRGRSMATLGAWSG